jgi:hypothetical protein
MPTYSFTRTREQFAGDVLQKLGVLPVGGTASGRDFAKVCDATDLRLKELHAIGVLWWQVSGAATNVSLTAGQVTATVSPTDFLFPVSLSLVVGSDEQPIEIIGHREYQAIQDKASQGEPVKAFFSGSTIRLWPVPDLSYTAKLTYQAIAADTENGAAPDVQTACLRALIDVVAGDLVDDYETPEPKASRLLQKQAIGLTTIRALNSQRVDAVTVTPDYF